MLCVIQRHKYLFKIHSQRTLRGFLHHPYMQPQRIIFFSNCWSKQSVVYLQPTKTLVSANTWSQDLELFLFNYLVCSTCHRLSRLYCFFFGVVVRIQIAPLWQLQEAADAWVVVFTCSRVHVSASPSGWLPTSFSWSESSANIWSVFILFPS